MLKPRPIDVIVPVQRAGEELYACIASVQRHGGHHRLVLVVDGLPDERLAALAGRRSATGSSRLVLLRNERRGDLVAAINRGLTFSRNDVVLLGPDAVVTRGWLNKIRRCAASDRRIGIITPFSNDGRFCSFPLLRQDNFADDPERVSEAIELAAVPLYPDLPAADAFCMFIRRRLIRDIGLFDEALGNAGGEDIDLCRRAGKAGYRSVLCDDAYVARLGLNSVGGERSLRAGGDSDRLAARHSEYPDLVREFTAANPVGPIRMMARSQLRVLSGPDKPGVLHVLHDRGGGTEKYVQELIAASSGSHRHYFLRILPDRWRLTDDQGIGPAHYDPAWRPVVSNGTSQSHYDYLRRSGAAQCDRVASLCAWLRIDLIHVHSLVGGDEELLEILERVAVPYCYTVHDMYLACPTVYLIDTQGRYCGATTDLAICRQCLSHFAGMEHIDIGKWRSRYKAFLDRASSILAPSQWARDTLEKYYPDIGVTVVPPDPDVRAGRVSGKIANGFDLPTDGFRSIGVLGAIGPEKGARGLETMVARIRERGLPLRVVVIGYTDRENRHQSDDKIFTVHGPYLGGEVNALLDHYGVKVALFPTVWPETFGYTLTEVWQAGRPALVPPGGALAERVLATGAGWIMSGWPDTDAILDQLMNLTAPGYAHELEQKAGLAREASINAHHNKDRVADIYRDILDGRPDKCRGMPSRMQIHEAACRALGIKHGTRRETTPCAGGGRTGAAKERLLRFLGKGSRAMHSAAHPRPSRRTRPPAPDKNA